MRGGWWIAAVALGLGGCASTGEERAREYNEDGVYLFDRGDYTAARASFQAALALKPEDTDLLYNLGECHDRQGGSAQAERCYAECLQRTTNHAACRHALAGLLVRTGRRTEAVRMVEDWLAREPKSADAYATDGWLWHQFGDLPRAQTRLQQALELDPHNLRALTELALVYEAMQRPDRAVVLYERVLAANPQQAEVTKRLNLLLAKGAGRPQPE